MLDRAGANSARIGPAGSIGDGAGAAIARARWFGGSASRPALMMRRCRWGGHRGHSPPPAPAGDPRSVAPRGRLAPGHKRVGSQRCGRPRSGRPRSRADGRRRRGRGYRGWPHRRLELPVPAKPGRGGRRRDGRQPLPKPDPPLGSLASRSAFAEAPALPLTAVLECENDARGRFTLRPSGDSHGGRQPSAAVAASFAAPWTGGR